jgi:hypothetical protein
MWGDRRLTTIISHGVHAVGSEPASLLQQAANAFHCRRMHLITLGIGDFGRTITNLSHSQSANVAMIGVDFA